MTNKSKRKSRKSKKKVVRYSNRNANFIGYASGMPHTRRANLRWVQNVELESIYGSLATSFIYASGLNFPLSGTHAPKGFSVWSGLYNHYTVVGAKATVTWTAGQATAAESVVCMINLQDDVSSPYTNYTQFIEAKQGSYKQLVFQRNEVVTTCKYSAKRFFNITDVKDNADRLGAVTTTNPSDSAYYAISTQSLDAAAASVKTIALVQIDYIVDFSEPKDVV